VTDPIRLDQAKLGAARLFATSTYPYLASALFASPVVAKPGSGTIAVDRRWTMPADPVIVDQLDTRELGRLLVHLTSHLLRDHAARAARVGVIGPGGDPARWNRATDAEINDDLAREGMIPSCAGDLAGSFDAEAGLLAETYYESLPTGTRLWDCGSGCDCVPRPGEDDASRPGIGIDERQAEWLRIGVAAEMQRLEQEEPGTVPGGWLRWAEQISPSKVDWRRVLAAEVRVALARTAGMVDYSYRRLSRRADAVPAAVLPSLERPVPEVAVVCDTSGSMGGEQLARVLVEVESLLQRAGLTQIRVLACDSEVHSVRRVSRAAQVQLIGGGGTDMGRGISESARLRPRPDVIVVLTDGWTPWPEMAPPGVRVVAGIIRDGQRAPRHLTFSPFPAPSWIRTVEITI
jgi:predicted metal-dependent peptidase